MPPLSFSASPVSISQGNTRSLDYGANPETVSFETIVELVKRNKKGEMSELEIREEAFSIYNSLLETYDEGTVVPGIPVDAPGIAVEPEQGGDSGSLVGGKRNKPTKRRKKYTKRIRKRKKTNKRSRKKQKK